MRRLVCGVVAALAVLTVSAFAAQGAGKRQLDAVKVAGDTTYGSIPQFLAQQKGWWQQAGIDPSINVSVNATATMTAIASGAVDFGQVNVLVYWAAFTQGLPVIAIAPCCGSRLGTSGIWVRADSGISNAAALVGKTYSVSSLGGANNLNFDGWMAKHGSDPSKVNIVSVPQASAIDAILSGRVDGGFLSSVFNAQARTNPATQSRRRRCVDRALG